MKTALLLSALLAAPASALELKTGVYELTGYNGRATDAASYKGTVTIERNGETYAMVWKIGRAQTQKGAAILSGDVLSVSYIDMSGRDAGVVSYRRLKNGTLDGLWAPHGAASCGREILVWKSAGDGQTERY